MNQEIKYVVIFRHPSKTATSMIRQPSARSINLKFDDALEIWYAMYSNIIKYADKSMLYIHYDSILMNNLDRLRRYLNVVIDTNFIDKKLNRSPKSSVRKKYSNLYLKLCELSDFDADNAGD